MCSLPLNNCTSGRNFCGHLHTGLSRPVDRTAPFLLRRTGSSILSSQRRHKGSHLGVYDDSLAWVEDAANGQDYDAAAAQITFTATTTQTTSDLVTQVLYDLCDQSWLSRRAYWKDIISHIRDGWNKKALHQMRLLDSVIKESQRLKPSGISENPTLRSEQEGLSNTDVRC